MEVQVRDKRHVALASSNTERQALQNALQRLRFTLNFVEVVNDPSTSIKKMIGKKFSWHDLCCDISYYNDFFN